jgi:3-phenylpropionate/trans-cinnamate dioxygenase ferredoxin subunit
MRPKSDSAKARRYVAFKRIPLLQGHPLSSGLLTGTTIMSQCDGSQFDITTGSVLRGPATRSLDTYEVREHDGKIELKI